MKKYIILSFLASVLSCSYTSEQTTQPSHPFGKVQRKHQGNRNRSESTPIKFSHTSRLPSEGEENKNFNLESVAIGVQNLLKERREPTKNTTSPINTSNDSISTDSERSSGANSPLKLPNPFTHKLRSSQEELNFSSSTNSLNNSRSNSPHKTIHGKSGSFSAEPISAPANFSTQFEFPPVTSTDDNKSQNVHNNDQISSQK